MKYNIGSHSLRKTWGKYYFEEKKDIATVMKILNHTSIQSTLRYIGFEKTKILEVYKVLNLLKNYKKYWVYILIS